MTGSKPAREGPADTVGEYRDRHVQGALLAIIHLEDRLWRLRRDLEAGRVPEQPAMAQAAARLDRDVATIRASRETERLLRQAGEGS